MNIDWASIKARNLHVLNTVASTKDCWSEWKSDVKISSAGQIGMMYAGNGHRLACMFFSSSSIFYLTLVGRRKMYPEKQKKCAVRFHYK